MITYAAPDDSPLSPGGAETNMLRPTLLALLLLAAFCPAASARQKTDRESQNLLGPVKSVSAERIDPADDSGGVKGPGRRRPLDAVTFDERGREVGRVIYDDYGFLVGTQSNTYDAEGRLAESSLKAEEEERRSREVYRYDAGSRLVEKLSYEGGGPEALSESFSYDARGRVGEVALSFRGKPAGKTTFRYDAAGRVSGVAFYTAGGKPALAPVGPCFGVHRLAYWYDARGRVAGERAFEPDNSLKRKTVYAYDDKGNVREESRTDAYGSTTFRHAYEYDERGNWTKRETRIVSKRSRTPDGVPASHERVQLVRRTITYY